MSKRSPQDVLRATINLGNPFHAGQEAGQAPTGLSIDSRRL
jgi:hypothetical protein